MFQYPALQGRRVLVVEDILLVAEELSDTLKDWGCEVIGPAAQVGRALDLVEREKLDGALLDVNLGKEHCFPIATVLRERRVPFIFLTGYDMPSAFPPEFKDIPRLPKPLDPKRLSVLINEHFCKVWAGSAPD
jgi:CheY-like chemotaxis protein